MVVGSAPSFPHGAIDPILELSELARARGVGFHTDACLGGFVLPWARQLGYPVPAFDFACPASRRSRLTRTSSATRPRGLRSCSTAGRTCATTNTSWRRIGRAASTARRRSPAAGPARLSAAAWASLLATGEQGFLDATRRILETAEYIKQEIRRLPGLRLLGDPLWVIAFAAADDSRGRPALDIYAVMDRMAQHGWALNGLFDPPAVHLCVTLRHTQPEVAPRFVADLRDAVEAVQREPATHGEMAPLYGLAARLPLRGLVADLLKRYLDMLYRV